LAIVQYVEGKIAKPHNPSLSFIIGVVASMLILGWSLLYVHNHRVA